MWTKLRGRNEAFKSIWITGASSGIGKALSEYYAAPGVTLGLASRGAEQLEEVANNCRRRGATVHQYLMDVSDTQEAKMCASEFLQQVGSVDLVIANAGIRIEEDLDFQESWIPLQTMSTNFMGVINTFAPFIPSMKKTRKGSLAVISSIAAFRGTPNSGAYSASKAAINVWTESLRLRLKSYGIQVSTLCVGFVNTEMTRTLPFWMPGLLSAERAAEMIADGIRKRKRVMTFPWQAKLLWTCFRILPGPIYDALILWAKAHSPNRTSATVETR